MTDQTSLKPDGDPGDEADASPGDGADADDATPTTDSGGEEIGILDVRELVTEVAGTLLDHPFDGITSVERADDGGWRAVFEVVERSAVPDTQDIIGRYELLLTAGGEISEYSLQQRFKRSELQGKAL